MAFNITQAGLVRAADWYIRNPVFTAIGNNGPVQASDIDGRGNRATGKVLAAGVRFAGKCTGTPTLTVETKDLARVLNNILFCFIALPIYSALLVLGGPSTRLLSFAAFTGLTLFSAGPSAAVPAAKITQELQLQELREWII